VSNNSGTPSRGFDQFRRFIGPLLVLFVLAGVAGYFLTRNPSRLTNASSEPDPLASEREAAPALQFTDFEEKSQKLEKLKGKVVLIGFWTAECSTCILELPEFQELAKRYRSEGLEVLAVNLDSKEVGQKAAREIWQRGGFQFASYWDAEKQIAAAFRVETLPSAIVLDRKGRMAFSSYGANDWQSSETARLIEDLLLEQ
jgi:thiol-disulfide isomerase/thioredoxin